jgi:hypothetical protein
MRSSRRELTPTEFVKDKACLEKERKVPPETA